MVEYAFSLKDFEIFILVLVRVSCFVYIAPFFGMVNVPNRVKIGLAVCITLLINGFVDASHVKYTGMIGYSVIVLKEGITGLLIGLAANICNSIILFAGRIIDMDIGLAMAQQFDPINRTQVSLTGNLYFYFLLMLLVVTDMHHVILNSFVDVFELVPINAQIFDWEHLVTAFVTYLVDLFVISFRIMLPIFACIMILNCILAILAKVAPQMNMFAVGMQLKIMVGFFVLYLTITLLPSIANFIFVEMRKMMVLFVEGMY